VWHGIKTRKEELVIRWSEIESIHIGHWERGWARYSNFVAANLADSRVTKTDDSLIALGIPKTKMQYYFLTIKTTKGYYYAFDQTFNLMKDARQAIIDAGKEFWTNLSPLPNQGSWASFRK
jgi:hypothetical protein